MIKVLHIGLSKNPGGIENVVLSWTKRLPNDIHFDILNTWDGPVAYENEFRKHGCEIIQIPARKNGIFAYRKRLTEIIKKRNYSIVHCHAMNFIPFDPILICNKINIPVIFHIHSVIMKYPGIPKRDILLNNIGKSAIQNKKYLKIACGEMAGESAFDDKHFTVIENGIDLSTNKFSLEQRIKIRSELNIKDNEYVIGHVGRFSTPKNYPFIIKTFSEILNTCPNAKLLLIGDVDKDKIFSEFSNKKLETKNIIFTGKVRSSDYYSAMDVFFLPSLYEGFSVSAVEAQAFGLPCVFSDKIDKSHKITNFVDFIPIDDPLIAATELLKYRKNNIDRNNVTLNPAYNIKNSSEKMFLYYREHVISFAEEQRKR